MIPGYGTAHIPDSRFAFHAVISTYLHPDLPLEWYEQLLHDIKARFPQVNVHGFSPPEIHFFTKVSKLPLRTVLERLQDETGGFTAFICWTFQPGHQMADVPAAGSFEYLKTQAVSRLYLDNFANIQSSWVTQGLKIGQIALLYGANDMGSLMIEENVVAAAGTVHYLTLDEMKDAIRERGYTPRRRNVFYQLVDDAPLEPVTLQIA